MENGKLKMENFGAPKAQIFDFQIRTTEIQH
jgi:hypothetical protein